MTQAIATPSKPAQAKAEKFEPGVQELRTKFAHIKRELRHIQRALTAAPPPQPDGPKVMKA